MESAATTGDGTIVVAMTGLARLGAGTTPIRTTTRTVDITGIVAIDGTIGVTVRTMTVATVGILVGTTVGITTAVAVKP